MRAARNSLVKKVIFTAGGPGSGKSEVIRTSLLKNFNGIIYDSNLANYEGARKQIDALKKMGKEVEIQWIAQDPMTAYRFKKNRELEGLHAVSDDSFIRGHTKVPDVIERLIADGENVIIRDMRGITMKKDLKNTPIIRDSAEILKRLQKMRIDKNTLQDKIKTYGVDNTRNVSGAQKGDVLLLAKSRADQGGKADDGGRSGQILRRGGGEIKPPTLAQIKELGRRVDAFDELRFLLFSCSTIAFYYTRAHPPRFARRLTHIADNANSATLQGE